MGVSDMQFDILSLLREEVSHLPRGKRREAFLTLARRTAQDFLSTAENYDLKGEESSRSGSDGEDSSDAEGDGGEPARRVEEVPSRDGGPPPKAPRHR